MNGIDVSKWQGEIDWSKVNVDFAIIRAGYGREISQKDEKFERNYQGVKKAGIPVGAYWYSYAQNADEARREAAVCIEVLKGKQFEMPIWYDVEESKSFPKADEIIRAFCDALEAAGYFVGLYMSRFYLTNYVSEAVRNRYAMWVAEYGSKLNYGGQYGIWQNSSTGKVNGINGNVDTDICYVDYPSIIKDRGLNGFEKKSVESKPTESKPVESKPVTYTVKKGDTLTAIAKKYKTSVKKLVELNGIENPNLIFVGQVLKIG